MATGCPGRWWGYHPWKYLDLVLGDVVWGYSGSAGYTIGLDKQSQNILRQKGPIRNIECTEYPRNPTTYLSSWALSVKPDVPTALRSVLQCSTTLWVNNLFLISNINSPDSAPFPRALSHVRQRRWVPAPTLPLVRLLKTITRSDLRLIFTKLNK